MSITITTDEGRAFPLGSDHAFAAANPLEAVIDYIRGDRALDGLAVPDAAFVFEVRHVTKGEVRRIKSRVRPRSSGRGLAAVAAIRKAGRDAYKEARRKLAPMGLQAGALEAQNRAMAEALDALSDADRDAHNRQEEHEVATAAAVAAAAVERITVGEGGESVRELVTEGRPDLARLWDGKGYPVEWVVEHVIMPTWTSRYRQVVADADAAQREAVKVRDAIARKLRESMLATNEALPPAEEVAELERHQVSEATVLAQYVEVWEACRDAQATTQLKRALCEEFERTDIIDKAFEQENLLAITLTDEQRALARELGDAFITLGEAEFAGYWRGEADPTRVLLEIGRHVMVGTGNPKA